MSNGTKGSGWITYSGIMLVIAGLASIVDAIWAFRFDDTVADLVVFEDSLATWGWIWLIVGVLLIAAGIGVFSGQSWARWTGIIVATIALISNLTWAQIQPTQGLIGALLAGLVVYGLGVYGDQAAT